MAIGYEPAGNLFQQRGWRYRRAEFPEHRSFPSRGPFERRLPVSRFRPPGLGTLMRDNSLQLWHKIV
jgi:hypothetical protein